MRAQRAMGVRRADRAALAPCGTAQSVGTVRRAGRGPKAVVGATSKRRRPGSAAIARGRASSLATAGMKWC